MSDVRNLVERLRQIAESQRMDFDSPNVAATLDDAATTLEALASIGSVVAEEPEWEYGAQHSQGTNPHPSRKQAEEMVAWHAAGDKRKQLHARGKTALVRRRKAGPWVEVSDA